MTVQVRAFTIKPGNRCRVATRGGVGRGGALAVVVGCSIVVVGCSIKIGQGSKYILDRQVNYKERKGKNCVLCI
jgi:hypothetical protein